MADELQGSDLPMQIARATALGPSAYALKQLAGALSPPPTRGATSAHPVPATAAGPEQEQNAPDPAAPRCPSHRGGSFRSRERVAEVGIGDRQLPPEFARHHWQRRLRRRAAPCGHVSVVSARLVAEANLAFGALFPSWSGELYWTWRKPEKSA